MSKRRCDRENLDVLRVARRRQVQLVLAKPTEHIEAVRPLLILEEVNGAARPDLIGLAEATAVEHQEPIAVRIRQRRQHHPIHHGVDRRGRADADRQRWNGQQSDALRVRPGVPGL